MITSRDYISVFLVFNAFFRRGDSEIYIFVVFWMDYVYHLLLEGCVGLSMRDIRVAQTRGPEDQRASRQPSSQSVLYNVVNIAVIRSAILRRVFGLISFSI